MTAAAVPDLRQGGTRHRARILSYAAIVVAGWTAALIISFTWNYRQEWDGASGLARTVARMSVNKDLVYRRWAIRHGGVYVPVTADTPPSPWLAHVPDRDITTPSGQDLTLLNSSYMTRQVLELGAGQYGDRGHITSLRPLRPQNAPDAWEAASLHAFESGTSEVSEITLMEGRRYMRLMIPMTTEADCMKCHGVQGYSIGDVRGGISVSIPMEPYATVAEAKVRAMAVGHGLVWVLGVAALFVGTARLLRHSHESERFATLLRENEARFRAVVEHAADALFLSDMEGHLVSVNRRACESLGYSSEELLQMNVGDVDVTMGRARARELSHALAGRAPVLFESMHRRKDGSDFPVEVRVGLVELEGRRLVLGVARDITERKREEAERSRLREQLHQAQKMEAVGHLASGVAHDFNNLLTVIFGNIDLIRNSGAYDQALNAHADAIIEAAEQATSVTRALLAFSRELPGTHRPLDLAETIRTSLKLLSRVLPASVNVQTQLDCEQPCWVNGDATQLQQVLMNLAINARDAMPGGGVLQIRLVTVATPADTSGESVELLVSDTGTGMTPQVQERMFQPFFTTKARSKGTGLGLAIVHRIIQQHGGTITVRSSPGQGAEFAIRLPAVPPAPVQKHEASAAGPARVGGTILMAEDDAQVAGAIRAVLRSQGYEVIHAPDGIEFLETARREPDRYDLLLIDYDLPRRNGVHCLQDLQREGWDVPSIIMTGNVDLALEGELRCEALLMRKPFGLGALTTVVAECLRARQSSAS